MRDDEGLQAHSRGAKAFLDLLYGLVKQDFRVARPEVSYPLGVDKDDMLLIPASNKMKSGGSCRLQRSLHRGPAEVS